MLRIYLVLDIFLTFAIKCYLTFSCTCFTTGNLNE